MIQKTLVLFGDSLLGRFGKSLIQELEVNLKNTTVLNCAAGGFNSEDGIGRVAFVAKLDPNYIIFSFGANDCAPWKKQVPIGKFSSNIESMIDSVKESQSIYFLCPPAHDPSDLESTHKFNGILGKYNNKVREICKKKGVVVIDSEVIYGGLLKNGIDYHMGDGIHLNEVGYKVLLESIKEVLK